MRVIIPVVLSLACCPLQAQDRQDRGPTTVPGLGTLTFPVSSQVAAARQAFLRGVLLLHLFEYADAAAAFRDAERLDVSFAMAYWGEAMTDNHPVWNEQDDCRSSPRPNTPWRSSRQTARR